MLQQLFIVCKKVEKKIILNRLQYNGNCFRCLTKYTKPMADYDIIPPVNLAKTIFFILFCHLQSIGVFVMDNNQMPAQRPNKETNNYYYYYYFDDALYTRWVREPQKSDVNIKQISIHTTKKKNSFRLLQKMCSEIFFLQDQTIGASLTW